VRIGTGAQGRIDRPRDVDLYRIGVSGGTARTLRAQVSGIAGLDLSLDLLDQAGNRVLGVNDGKPGEPEIISAVTLSSGTYYLRVREAPGKAPPRSSADLYTLTWQLGAPEPNTEQEPNDKPALATPLQLGQEMSGQLAWRRDEDYYRVTLAGTGGGDGGTAVAMALRVDVSGLEGVALTVQVLDSIGTRLAQGR